MISQILEKPPLKSSEKDLRSNFETTATIFMFWTVISALALCSWFITPPRMLRHENRQRAESPDVSLSWSSLKYAPAAFEKYYNDRFAFRDLFLTAGHLINYSCFNWSGTPEVIAGPDGWLELGHYNLQSYLNSIPFTQKELERIGQSIESRSRWLAARGIRYLFILVPNKSTIYPQSMPSYYQKQARRPSRMDQLLSYLQTHTSVQTIDLRPLLKKNSKAQLLYWKTDTHWNKAGARLAYQAIVDRLSQWFPNTRDNDSLIVSKAHAGGDLAKLIGLDDFLAEDTPNIYSTRKPQWSESTQIPRTVETVSHLRSVSATEIKNSDLPSAVIMHDSTVDAMRDWLPTRFRRVLFFWTNEFPTETILVEKPDIVIDEHVERMLLFPTLFPTKVESGNQEKFGEASGKDVE